MGEIRINKHLSALVGSTGVVIEDDQHGDVTLSGESLERVFSEYLNERQDTPDE